MLFSRKGLRKSVAVTGLAFIIQKILAVKIFKYGTFVRFVRIGNSNRSKIAVMARRQALSHAPAPQGAA
jgi:hypothetical protein